MTREAPVWVGVLHMAKTLKKNDGQVGLGPSPGVNTFWPMSWQTPSPHILRRERFHPVQRGPGYVRGGTVAARGEDRIRSTPPGGFSTDQQKKAARGRGYTALVLVEKDQLMCAPPEIRGSCVSIGGIGWDGWGVTEPFSKK